LRTPSGRALPGPIQALRKLARVTARRDPLLSFKVAVSSKYILAYWWGDPSINNFGDVLNPFIIAALSGREVVHCYRVVNIAGKPVYWVVGSVLRFIDCSNAVVWGSGFVDSEDTIPTGQLPKKVLAVRGPLTREKLLRLGVECPEVYGDPALLCPMFFKPATAKLNRLGFVPHYVDRNSPLLDKFRKMPGVSVIDVTGGVEDVVRGITECEVIASSSLHGLVVADAYGIPSMWLKISGKLRGDDFKFHDYLLSVGRRDTACVQLTDDTTLDSLLASRTEYRIQIDLGELLKVCPFRDDRRSPVGACGGADIPDPGGFRRRATEPNPSACQGGGNPGDAVSDA